MPEGDNKNLDHMLRERFAQLPKVVQDAITSAHVEKHLRMLASKHKLHLDQWQLLENEVVMALMGLERAEDLEQNIREGLGVEGEVARELAADIMGEVFEPIREQLERELDHPQSKPRETEPIEDMRAQILARAKSDTTTPSPDKNAAAEEAPVGSGAGASPEEPNTTLQSQQQSSATSSAPQQEQGESLDTAPDTAPASAAEQTTTKDPADEQNISSDTTPPESSDTQEQGAPDNEQDKKRPVSTSYVHGKPSMERKDVDGDPYRESVDE